MASLPFGTTFRRLLHRIDPRPAGDRTDGVLLARFAAERDETAFTALVARHGPMVLGVCRRVLADQDDAEDAFQATFLVLARKAAALDGTAPLGSWLYTVARNLAIKLRGQSACRRNREKEAGAMPKSDPQGTPRDELAWREVRAVLDDELGRLPEKYRAPLVLCHLEGMTHEAAAKELGWPAGSMAKRLARGQELLRERLAGRGVTLSLAALLLLVTKRGSAAVPATMAEGVGRAAVQFVAGKSTGTLASATAVALAGSALQSAATLKIAALLLLGVGVLGAGAGAALIGGHGETPVAQAAQPGAPRPPAVGAKAEDKTENENERLRSKLAQPVNLDKGIDPNTPLKDALEFLAERYDLKLQLDEKAFSAYGVEKVAEQPVQLPRMVGASMRVVLNLLMTQIVLDDGLVGGVRVKNGVIELLPIDPSEPGDNYVSPKLQRRLLRPVAWDTDIPAGTPVGKVLELLAGRYGEKLTLDEKSFAAVGRAGLRDVKVESFKLNATRENLVTILDWFMVQLNSREAQAVYRVRRDGIEIAAVKPDSPEAKAALRALRAVRLQNDADRRAAVVSRKLEKGSAEEIKIDPNTPLHDALEFLSDKFDMTLIVDTKAFEMIGIQKVDEVAVQLPPQKNAKIGAMLQALLDQIVADDWVGGLIVREDYIEIAPLHKHVKQQKPLTKKQLDGFWEELAGSHWRQPVMASETFVQFPEQTVALLRERLRPVSPPDPKKKAEAARWVKDLDSDEFAVRQKATDELEKLGKDALGALRDQLQAKPTAEMRQRVEQLLEKIDLPAGREQLRDVRAIHLLEQIGTPDAEQLLETLAKGAKGAMSTEKARAALERLNR